MGKRKILIVDDEPAIRESLAEFLGDFQFTVETAGTGENALARVEKESFAVLIADLRLPGMTGEELILAAHRARPQLQFLIHTGSIDYRLSAELQQIGVREEQIILKPLPDLMALVAQVEALLN